VKFKKKSRTEQMNFAADLFWSWTEHFFCELMAAERKRKKKKKKKRESGRFCCAPGWVSSGGGGGSYKQKRKSSRTTGPKEATTHTGQEEGKRAGESERDL
jgi:hypothetical protein